MISRRLLLTLFTICSLVVLAQAQTAYIWESITAPSCQAGATITTTNDLDWRSPGCVDAKLSASNTRVSILDDYANPTFYAISGIQSTNTNYVNVLPGTLLDAGVLSWSVTGDLQAVATSNSFFHVRLLQQNAIIQEIVVPFEGLINPLDCGVQLVAGGSTVSISQVELIKDANWPASTPFDLTFNYTFTPIPGGVSSTLNNISVPDSDFNGSTYEHILPSGDVNILPISGVFEIGLENNTPTEQIINISKSGGTLIIAGDAEIQIQESTSTMEPHEVNVSLDSVSICLGNSEFIVEEGASLTLNSVPLTYESGVSCLGAHTNGRIVIAQGANQTFGNQGYGMQLFDEGSVTEVREDATLTLDNQFYLVGDDEAYFDVLPGATLNVTEFANFSRSSEDERLVVRLRDGGTFDMSRAPVMVQKLFRVEAISSNQNLMPDGTFTTFPNPAQAGRTFVHKGTGALQLTQIDIVDLTGRVVSTQQPAQNNEFYPVRLPDVAGLYVIRLTDVDGRIGHLRIMRN